MNHWQGKEVRSMITAGENYDRPAFALSPIGTSLAPSQVQSGYLMQTLINKRFARYPKQSTREGGIRSANSSLFLRKGPVRILRGKRLAILVLINFVTFTVIAHRFGKPQHNFSTVEVERSSLPTTW